MLSIQVVQPAIVLIEALLVDLGYVQQAGDALPDFTQALVALLVLGRELKSAVFALQSRGGGDITPACRRR